MRLTPQERMAICAAIQQVDSQSAIYLYGSRVHDKARGGDIDLLVFISEPTLAKKLELLFALEVALGERKIDLTLRPLVEAGTTLDPFVAHIFPTAMRLDTPK